MAQPKPTIRLLDGGMGTYLESHHAVLFDSSKPAWSSSVSPSLLRQVHEEYARSGADILLTATYQATAENLADSGGLDASPAGRKAGVEKLLELVRACTQHDVTEWNGDVALSLGPYGATMVPSTEYSGAYEKHMQGEEALKEWHLRRLRDYAFVGDRAASIGTAEWFAINIIAFETLVSATEVWAVRGAMHDLLFEVEYFHGKFWVSVNFPNGSVEEPLSPRGETAEEIGRAMFQEGKGLRRPRAVGVNCTKLNKVDAVVRGLEKALLAIKDQDKDMQWPALVVYPDGAHNLKYNTTTKTWDPIDDGAGAVFATWAEQMEALLKQVVQRGRWSSITLGGCCKTTPDDIGELRQRLADLPSVQLYQSGANKAL